MKIMKTKICPLSISLAMLLVAAPVLLAAEMEKSSRAEVFAAGHLNARHGASKRQQDEESLCRVKDSPAGYANVRSAPNLNGRIVATLKSGALAYPGDSMTDDRGVVWAKVRRSRHGKFLGWVSIVNLECAG